MFRYIKEVNYYLIYKISVEELNFGMTTVEEDHKKYIRRLRIAMDFILTQLLKNKDLE